MDRSRPNVFHRGAAAFLACFQTLTLLGRNRDGGRGANLSVGIHTVSVAEKAKYRLVICYNKKKRRTAWKKVATHDWDFTAEFADSVPEEKKKVRVELQRKKKCKVKTIGVTTLDPTRALQEDGPVLVKDWYVFDPPKKGRQDKNVSLLEATVAVKGLKVERKTTQETGMRSPTPPSKENAKPEVRPESSAELKARDVTAETTCQAAGAEKLDTSVQDKLPAPSSGDNTECRPASTGATSGSPSSTTTNGAGDVKPSRIRTLFGFVAKKKSETIKSTDEGVTTKASDATNEETVAIEGQLKSSSDKKESQLAPKTAVQTAEEEKPGETGQDKPTVPPCGCVECTKLKSATSSTNSSTSLSPTISATDKSLTNGDGDAGHAKPKSERPSRFRQLVSFMKKDNSKATADQPPPQFTDPLCLDMMSCIRELWEDLIPKRAYSKELFDYANTLMAKLEAAAPHTKENTILKNLFAKVPDYTHYELPEMEGLSLQELNQIHKTTECLLDEEDRRATFIRRWLIDDICRVALEEAPKVLESTGPP
ncbi:PREDICTED: uncharacterized protein LOC109478964 [Branchiostoma belcheri]|uniref:Uncharacterized protein LOC109478964 n=1 Tax=Branchiostoma belcheri TaxID=7741 RepID=A0A6P5A3N0_BRABE|nr:PREDICTED: uncharacterized protein LOC109478964 [Branchiostoma belcheri]